MPGVEVLAVCFLKAASEVGERGRSGPKTVIEAHADAGVLETDAVTAAAADAEPAPAPEGTHMWSVGQPPGGLRERDEFVEMRHRVVLRVALRATRGIPKADPALFPFDPQIAAAVLAGCDASLCMAEACGISRSRDFLPGPAVLLPFEGRRGGGGPHRTCGGAPVTGGGDVGGWPGLQSAVGSDSRSRRGRRPRESGCPVVTTSGGTESRSRFDLAGHGNCGRTPCPTRTPEYLSGNDPAGDLPGGAASARCSCYSGIPPVVPSPAFPLWDASPSFRPFRPAPFRPFWDCPSCL